MSKPNTLSGWLFALSLLAFAGFWAFAFLGPSKPPVPRTWEQRSVIKQTAADGHEKPKNYGQGTKAAPFIVEVQHTPETQDEAERDADYRERKATDDWIIWWAGFAVWVEIGQALALIATFSIALFVAIRQLRAYIQVEGANVSDAGGLPLWFAGGVAASFVVIKNTGQTPAKRVIHYSAVVVAPVTDEHLLVAPKVLPEVNASALGAQATANAMRWMSRQLTDRELTDINNKVSAIYVYGKVVYHDVFRRRRETSYRLACFVYPPPPNVIMQFTQSGNDIG